MNADRWEKLQELFHRIEQLPPAERESVLTAECGDQELRRRVLGMLRASDRLNRSPADTNGAAPPHTGREASKEKPLPFEKAGPYRLIRCVGAGGMGTVYLAEREVAGAKQRAALKMLAPHAAGPAFIERFEREQHILASLEHPNITRMLDAGLSDTGQPYLVMEFVEGKPFDRYCDDNRLTIEQRLSLFIQVCTAVDYAHRNLIVHLDLKPSNILITAGGIPKLLDFGTSKLISLDGRLTSTYSATPSYASPEHLRNEAVTTGCDVYSLGVVLFELLTGKRPSGNASIATIIERAMKDLPPPPLAANVSAESADVRGMGEASLRALLGGDLSTIVRKALANQTAARYSSVHALAGDIQRYLNHQPILARPQTTLYWLGKFVRRHRAPVAIGAFLLFALTAAIIYAFAAQRRAVAESARVARTQTFMNQLFRLANANYAGKQVSSLNDFLALGLKMAPVLAPDKRQLAEIEASLAASTRDSGNPAAAVPAFQKAVLDARAVGDLNTEVECLAYLCSLKFDDGDRAQAIRYGREAVAKSTNSLVSAKSRAQALTNLGYALVLDNQNDISGLRMLEQAAALSEKAQLPLADRAYIAGVLAWADSATSALNEQQRNAATQKSSLEAIALYKSLPISLCQVALPYIALARNYRAQHRLPEAERLLRDAYQQVSVCLGSGYDLSLSVLGQWGYTLVWVGKAAEAKSRLEEGLAQARKTYEGRNAVFLTDLLGPLALADEKLGLPRQAEQLAREMLKLVGDDPNRSETAEARRTLGLALLAQQRDSEALPYLEAAAASYAKHAPNSLFAAGLNQALAQAKLGATR